MSDPLPNDERAALVNRMLPEMQLSDGSAASLTAPPAPMPASWTAAERALARFSVHGVGVITGGAGTLALEASRALLEHGLSALALLDVNPAQSAEPIAKLRADFPLKRIEAYQVDVRSSESVARAFEAVARDLGGVDVLCCFAGVVGCVHALEITEAEWRKTIDVNTTGSFLCAQAAARQMVAQGRGGRIVLVASMSGHRVNYPQPQVAYNVSKSAVINLVHSLAAEWAVHGIRVNSLSPGYMDTILNEGPGLASARKIWESRNPMGRMGAPPELTGPLVMLCSQYAGAFITGTDLVVDGGAIVF